MSRSSPATVQTTTTVCSSSWAPASRDESRPSAKKVKPMIVLLKDPDSLAPRRLPIEKPEIVLGKSADCDVVLSSPKVSRRHARIAVRDGGLVIEDLKSTNGTFV